MTSSESRPAGERPTDADARFRALFQEHSRPLLGYALRRVAGLDDAADVLADTMLVAWRRIDEVPPGEETRPWLFGVARHVLLNHHRADRRGLRLGERLKAQLEDVSLADPADAVGTNALVQAAMAQIGDDDREILRLTAWEGLDPSEISVAMGIPAATARTRLHRARVRLRRELERQGWEGERGRPAGHEQSGGRVLARDPRSET